MDLTDARAFVIPRGTYNGQTIQAVASGHLDDVREMIDDEPAETDFHEALETFLVWTDSESDPDVDVPPDPEDLVEGELDDDGEIGDPTPCEHE